MDIVAKAREFAETKHLGQKKKYVEQPYFKHVEAVVNILGDAGIDDTTTLAAAYSARCRREVGYAAFRYYSRVRC